MNLFKRIVMFLLFGIVLLYVSFSLFKGTKAISDVPANPAFDDINFYKCVIYSYNTENKTNVRYDTNLSDEQLKTIKELNCNFYSSLNIVSAKGVEKLTNLTRLDVRGNQLTKLDVSKNTNLTYLNVGENQLSELDVSNNVNLETLSVFTNKLTKLDISNNINLTVLSARYNQLTKLDVSKNLNLTSLDVNGNQITELDVSNNTYLNILYAHGNKLTKLDVNNNINLEKLNVYNNQLTKLDISKNLNLTYLGAVNNQLKEIDISNNLKLGYLEVGMNKLTELDVSNNMKLHTLCVEENELTILDLSKNLNLQKLYVNDNKLTELDLKNNIYLNELYAKGNKLIKLDVSKNSNLQFLYVYNNPLTQLDISNNMKLRNFSVDINLYIYKGNEFNIRDKIKLPEHLNYEENIKNSNIVILDDEGNGIATDVGVVIVEGNVKGTNITSTTTINIVEITSSKYLIDNINDEIGIGFDSISYDDFISNINIPEDISIKVFDNDREVKSGDITLGMKVIVYYKDELLNTFDITDEYLMFDDSLTIYKNYVANVLIDTNVKKLLELINTSGKVSIYDKNGNLMTNEMIISSGSKIKIEMYNTVIEYDVFFKGDVDGDGKLGLSDIMKLSKYVYVDKNSLRGVYLVVADYNMDNKYNLQDIMKIANKIYKGGE